MLCFPSLNPVFRRVKQRITGATMTTSFSGAGQKGTYPKPGPSVELYTLGQSSERRNKIVRDSTLDNESQERIVQPNVIHKSTNIEISVENMAGGSMEDTGIKDGASAVSYERGGKIWNLSGEGSGDQWRVRNSHVITFIFLLSIFFVNGRTELQWIEEINNNKKRSKLNIHVIRWYYKVGTFTLYTCMIKVLPHLYTNAGTRIHACQSFVSESCFKYMYVPLNMRTLIRFPTVRNISPYLLKHICMYLQLQLHKNSYGGLSPQYQGQKSHKIPPLTIKFDRSGYLHIHTYYHTSLGLAEACFLVSDICGCWDVWDRPGRPVVVVRYGGVDHWVRGERVWTGRRIVRRCRRTVRGVIFVRNYR